MSGCKVLDLHTGSADIVDASGPWMQENLILWESIIRYKKGKKRVLSWPYDW